MENKKEQDLEVDWKEIYPGYQYKNKESLLKEWDLSTEALKGDERLINIVMIFGAAFASIFNALIVTQNTHLISLIEPNGFAFILIDILVMMMIGIYISESMKSIVWAKRKLLIIRRILGIDWGTQRLVLPTYRLEGAAHPFVIKMFPGCLSASIMPFVFILMLNIFIIFYLSRFAVYQLVNDIWYSEILRLIVVFLSFCLITITFRINLFDEHENIGLYVTKVLAKSLNFKMVENFEYAIYKARLCVNEAKRLGVDFKYGKEYAIKIEDKRFFKHKGIDFRSIARAIIVRVPVFGKFIGVKYGINRSSGGSTISQQVVRTIFFTQYRKKMRRKIFEIVMARFWLEKVFSKEEILEIYLASITYTKGKPGLFNGIKHYGILPENLDVVGWFFMVERVAYSVKGIFNQKRIDQLIDDIFSENKRSSVKKFYGLYMSYTNNQERIHALRQAVGQTIA
jgi:penicillin-binding protein 1A